MVSCKSKIQTGKVCDTIALWKLRVAAWGPVIYRVDLWLCKALSGLWRLQSGGGVLLLGPLTWSAKTPRLGSPGLALTEAWRCGCQWNCSTAPFRMCGAHPLDEWARAGVSGVRSLWFCYAFLCCYALLLVAWNQNPSHLSVSSSSAPNRSSPSVQASDVLTIWTTKWTLVPWRTGATLALANFHVSWLVFTYFKLVSIVHATPNHRFFEGFEALHAMRNWQRSFPCKEELVIDGHCSSSEAATSKALGEACYPAILQPTDHNPKIMRRFATAMKQRLREQPIVGSVICWKRTLGQSSCPSGGGALAQRSGRSSAAERLGGGKGLLCCTPSDTLDI